MGGSNHSVAIISPSEPATKPAGVAKTVSRNIAISLVRLAINSLIALVLPAYLTHHLPVTTYGAWVLILQLGALVSFLDFGIQTGVAKFVAEYEAKGDELGAGRYASAGLVIMTLTGMLGLLLTVVLSWQVPRLFHNMPPSLYRDVRISVVLIGGSLSFGLVCSVFAAVFVGLQRYAIPMGLAILNRVTFTAAVLVAVFLHKSLATMGTAAAVVNITTGLLQVVAWRQLSSRIRISLKLVGSQAVKQMARYCFLIAIWSAGMICVSGLDVTIVGHYAYGETAFYSIATLPITFLISLISSMLGPMMPASSALSMQRSPIEMGDILARITRYSTLLLFLTGLPFLVFGYPILSLWVGPVYAAHSLTYLRILILSNIIRNLCAPYATMIAATGRQGAATITAVVEAVVNLASSVYLATKFGAIGVAFGTLLGSFMSVGLHFAVSMHFTQDALAISRSQLFLKGIIRPLVVAIPTALILLFWLGGSRPSFSAPLAILWAITTLLLAWFGSLKREERNRLIRLTRSRLMLSAGTGC
jgi:O-antigen/teichoic acid export membrane protein